MIGKAWMAALLGAAAALAQPQQDLVFDKGSPLASNTEIARRMLSPLGNAELDARLAAGHTQLRDQPIDPAQEKFTLYVPPKMPNAGYGLLVFVPPWDEKGMPRGWQPVLDDRGIIYVAAQKSGNAQNVLSRRVPLALVGAANVMARYKVDPARIYAGGMSGGSKVAMKLALGWPDLFQGALLNAGSETVGRSGVFLPPRALMLMFQQRRLVYVTGDRDAVNLDGDALSLRSMRAACMFNIDRITMRGRGHDTADASSLDRALALLDQPPAPDAKLAACRAEIDADWGKGLDAVAALIDAGDRDRARDALVALDARYGGVAAPRSVALAARLGPQPGK